MRGQNASYGGSGDVRHNALRDELARQFGAIPLGEATTQQIRAFAGQAHHVDRDLRGKNRPWPRGQGRLKDRPDAGQENAWPSGGPRSVARQRPAPPRIGRPLRPVAGLSSPGGPVLRQWWSTVATVPVSAALRGTAQCVRTTCGHVPRRSPPSLAVNAREEIPARALHVKAICRVFHDELYLATPTKHASDASGKPSGQLSQPYRSRKLGVRQSR